VPGRILVSQPAGQGAPDRFADRPAPDLLRLDLRRLQVLLGDEAVLAELAVLLGAVLGGLGVETAGLDAAAQVAQAFVERQADLLGFRYSLGQRYDVRMEFYEDTGNATARLLWSTPAMARTVVPAARLFPSRAAIRVNFQTASAALPTGWNCAITM